MVSEHSSQTYIYIIYLLIIFRMLSILDCELEIVDDFMSSLLCLFFFWFACRMSIFKSVYIYIYSIHLVATNQCIARQF